MEDLRSEFRAATKAIGAQLSQRKWLAEHWIDRTLDAIAADDREPDEWEASELLAAIDAIERRKYAIAMSCIEKAMSAEGERAVRYSREAATPTSAEIRTALINVRLRSTPST